MNSAISYLAQAYFHPDYQDETDEPVVLIQRFRGTEAAGVVDALRTEVTRWLHSEATEEELFRNWLECGAYFDPRAANLTMRRWLRKIAEVLDEKPDPGASDSDPAAPPSTSPGIPTKGTTQA